MAIPYQPPARRSEANDAPTPRRGIDAVLRDKLAESDADGTTPMERIAEALIRLAAGGDLRAMALVMDRTEGKPGRSLGLQGDCTPIQCIEIRYANDWRTESAVKSYDPERSPDTL